MRYHFSLILVAASLVAAQTIQQFFPACSIDCLTAAIGSATTCKTDDGVCICVFDNYVSIVDSATNCVIQACGSDDAVHKVLPAAADFCAAVTSRAGIATNTGTATTASVSGTSVPSTAAITSTTGSARTTTTGTTTANNAGTTSSVSVAQTTSSTGAAATAAPVGLFAMFVAGAALI